MRRAFVSALLACTALAATSGFAQELVTADRVGDPNAPKGNLYVVINVQEHEFFKRRNNDIILDININVAQAALGDAVRVPTIEGDIDLNIPPVTNLIEFVTSGLDHVQNPVPLYKRLSNLYLYAGDQTRSDQYRRLAEEGGPQDPSTAT